jgi:WD40 repeat protein
METCPNPESKGKTVPINNWDSECCEVPSTPCCNEDTAVCLACQICMTPQDFCATAESISTRRLLPNSSARRLRGQYGTGDQGGQKVRPWWGRFTHRVQNAMEARFKGLTNGQLDAMDTKATEFQLKVEEQLRREAMAKAAADAHWRISSLVGRGAEVARDPDRWMNYSTFNAQKNKILDEAAENIPPGCVGDDIPVCSWKLKSTFTPVEGNQGPATTVSVLKAGERAIVGFRESSNLYQFNLRSGKPDIPHGRHAEGTLREYGILVAGEPEGGTVTSSALMLDGSEGAVGYTNGKVTVFNSGDVYYPPDSSDPASESALESSAVNAIASMPSWSSMLLAMSNGWTLMYQFNNGGIVRFPRNVTTLNETIALRQKMITAAFETRFSTGSNPPDPKAVAEFYASIPDTIENNFGDIDLVNKEALGRATNEPYSSPVNDVVYVPISTKFATAHGDGKVRYWSSMNGNQMYQMVGHEGAVNALAAHPTKEIVASGGNDGTVRVWLMKGQGKQILLFDQKKGGPVRSLAFLPGGTTLVSGADDGILRRYNIRTGERDCHTITYAGATTTMSADPLMPGQLAIGTASGTAMVYR